MRPVARFQGALPPTIPELIRSESQEMIDVTIAETGEGHVVNVSGPRDGDPEAVALFISRLEILSGMAFNFPLFPNSSSSAPS